MVNTRRATRLGVIVAVFVAAAEIFANVAANYATNGVGWFWWPVLVGIALGSGLLVWWLERRAERRVAEQLLEWFVKSRRVLWKPTLDEIPHEAIESVVKIRERVDEDSGKLDHPMARQSLDTIRSACLDILDEPREWFAGIFTPEGERALIAFRKKVHPAAETLALAYGIEPPKWPLFQGGWEDEGVPIYIPPRNLPFDR